MHVYTMIDSINRQGSQMLRSSNAQLAGQKINDTNLDLLIQALCGYSYVTSDVMEFALENQNEIVTAIKNTFRIFSRNDISDLITYLADVRAYLVRIDMPTSYHEFKAHVREMRGNILSHDATLILTPVMNLIRDFLACPTMSGKQLAYISTYLCFLKKLEFQSIGLEDKMIEAYLADEADFNDIHYESELTDALADIIGRWMKGFHPTIIPKHGNGSTAEGRINKAAKYAELRYDDVLLRMVRNYSGYRLENDNNPLSQWCNYGLKRCSRIAFVPKNATKLRTISAEPATLQYYQHGVQEPLYRWFSSHPYLGSRMNLNDQTVNQQRSYVGSVLPWKYATLDLSSASDRVSLVLVKKLLAKCPFLYKWCIATRSTHTLLPNGVELKLNKFAPMGSALCFPIESLVFGAVCEYAGSIGPRQTGVSNNDWSVYGDDMIVPTHLYDTVVDILTRLHMKVNGDKSFQYTYFKESCGTDWYNGILVSPLYYRLPIIKQGSLAPAAFESLCAACNYAEQKGFKNYRRYLISILMQQPKRFRPLFTDTKDVSPMIYSPQPTNFHLITANSSALYLDGKSANDYQTDMVRRGSVKTISVPPNRKTLRIYKRMHWFSKPPQDEILYFEWLRDHRDRKHAWTDTLYPLATVEHTVERSDLELVTSYAITY